MQSPVLRRNKSKCQKTATETISIINDGFYEIQSSRKNISSPITTLYLEADIVKYLKLRIEDDYIPLNNRFVREHATPGLFATEISVVNDSSFGAAQKLRSLYPNDRICVLNFASASTPGGGFLTGAQAQEEALARCSTLYASLSDAKCFYKINQAAKSKVYTHNIIYSSSVTVFRDDSQNENLLDIPYMVDVISCPAVNRRLTNSIPENAINDVMIERSRMMFSVAKNHKVDHLILGAWGCGVFKNDPSFVVNMFLNQLKEDFNGVFKSVIFAVIGDENYECFQEAVQ
jgi:uncharacterized protein (TIGR02452 family)